MQPAPQQPVRFSLPDLGEVWARIESADAERLRLALTISLASPLERVASRDATVEFTTALGLCRIQGEVLSADPSGVVEMAVAGQERIQRREHVRVPVVRPVSIELPELPSAIGTWTVDLSAGGLLLAGPDVLDVGTRLGFTLDLEARRVDGEAVVVRDTPEGRHGLRIERISAADRELLVHFVFARQREEMKRGLK